MAPMSILIPLMHYLLVARTRSNSCKVAFSRFCPCGVKTSFFLGPLNRQTVRKSTNFWKCLGAYRCYTGHWKCSCPQSYGLDVFQWWLWQYFLNSWLRCRCRSRGTKCLWGLGKGLRRFHECKQWRHGCLPVLFWCTPAVQAHHLSRLSSMTSLTLNSGLCLCQEMLWCWWHIG